MFIYVIRNEKPVKTIRYVHETTKRENKQQKIPKNIEILNFVSKLLIIFTRFRQIQKEGY